MRKNIFISFILFVSSFAMINGQTVSGNNSTYSYKDFPQEKIFVHFNSSFLVSGENLLFKVYCLNKTTNKLSNLSKVAYVELINSDTNTIIKQKILLNSGLGNGDFFIKASIPSGNYKLVAYTQWMRNAGESTFFQNNVTIINPFKASKKLSIETTKNQNSDVDLNQKMTGGNGSFKSKRSNLIKLNISKKSFGKREKVILTLNSLKNTLSHGNYSVSVKKIDGEINAPARISVMGFMGKNNSKVSSKDLIRYLPELRGEIISGKVFHKETNAIIPNIKVSLSILGENPIFKIASTNTSGIFYFNIDDYYKKPDALIQVVDEEKDKYKIELKNYEQPNYSSFVFNDFKLTPKLNQLILKKSISNQVENAFRSIKKDSVLSNSYSKSSYEFKEKKYALDDYSRFKTLKETIIEVVDAVYLVQKKDSYTLNIKFYNINFDKSSLLPLVLMDGVVIQDHNTILDYDAHTIKSISIVRDKYVYGGQDFMGVISIETLKGDFKYPTTIDYIKGVNLDVPQADKIYFKQEYMDDSSLNRIPDFRSQLIWSPNINLNTNQKHISFYTSDNVGEYEIRIEGFTNNGEPVSVREFISVKDF